MLLPAPDWGGFFSSLLCAALWLLYFSIVTSAEGTAWYAYGWESQPFVILNKKWDNAWDKLKPAPCFCFEGFMFIWFYVHIYIYIYICTSLLGEKIGWGFFKNPCRNQLLSNKIVIVELFFCGSIVFKENNGRFFQFFVVELLLDFFDQISPCFL